jgi:outer membrane lipoprotein-sorting protein
MAPAALAIHLLTLLWLVSPQASAKGSDDLFAQIFQRGVVKQQTMRSISARFVETTVSTLLVKPIVARGTIVAASPARVRMTYTEPEPKTITMDGRSLTVVWPNRRERERIDITSVQKRVDQYFTKASIDELRKMFEITAEPDPSMRRTDRISMRPKRKQIKEGLSHLELWIDRETDLLAQMRMTFPGGDQKTIVLEEIAVNVPVNDETFQVRP